MSVATNKKDGSTVITLTSDPVCVWRLLFGHLKALCCCSPVCCSVSEHLRRVQGGSQSALGATQIMVGVINIVLGIIVGNNSGDYWHTVDDWYPVMLGFLFAAFGTMSILSEKYPSPCLVIASVIANLAGVAFAIAAITLYCFFDMGLYGLCQRSDTEYWFGEWITMPRIPSVEEKIMMEKCREAATMARKAFFTFPAMMSVLELCLVISSAVLGIKSLVRSQKENNKTSVDPNLYRVPLLKEISTITG
ncbi:transmembrane protein 176B-like [Centropristis striata]|uniref:transmembrane protein 176B-like n=1 Tax=Centropristis striata TaxID=184440 RepID=UPI0027E1F144|nr:transmembrane protein 176B-like [Centropristis striata]